MLDLPRRRAKKTPPKIEFGAPRYARQRPPYAILSARIRWALPNHINLPIKLSKSIFNCPLNI